MASNEHNPQPAVPHNGGQHAEHRTAALRANQQEWQDALATAQNIPTFARPSPTELDTLAAACTEPRRLSLLLDAFARHAATLQASHTANRSNAPLPTSQNNTHLPASQGSDTSTVSQASDTSTASQGNAPLPVTPVANQSETTAIPTRIAPSQLPYALLCDYVDDSSHDLREWINALTVFSDWLSEHNQPPQPLTMLLPYLSCSAEAQANSPMPLPLPHIVADMLELYGYEGSLGS